MSKLENCILILLLIARKKRADYMKRYLKKWQYQNRDKFKRTQREWAKQRRDRDILTARAKSRAYHKKRMETNLTYRVSRACRERIRAALRGVGGKEGGTTDILVGGVARLVSHIEGQLKPEWTWENYGKVWQIDHIKPVSTFDLSESAGRLAAFHWSNCQPLSIFDNQSKGNRIQTIA